ncbi:MAG TPA: ATP-binding cassette domain-containing protein [Candidatus Dormibacteraeota bacterium]|nr:ATP-binding cassette domain-containing protein [Candidatus Dormibacteraeota bacterium]
MARPVALEIRDVLVQFGGVRAVDVEHMAIRRGRIAGLIGQNGAGKTTLFDVISGFVPQRRGSVVLDGEHELTGLSPVQRAHLGLGRSFQAATLFESLTVAESLMVAFHTRMESSGPLSSALQLPWARREERAVRVRVDELIDLMGLGAFHDKFISELSTGTRRIVDLAGVLALQPSVLLLDEPSSGIAQREVEQLGALLREVREALDCTMVVVEHDIPLVRTLCDELYAMETGRVIAHGTCDEVLSDDKVVESYLGGGSRAVERSGAATAPVPVAMGGTL